MLTDADVLKHLTPIELVCPLQIGEIYKFLEQTDRSTARKFQDGFTAIVVVEILLFAAYFVWAIFSIGYNHPAKDAPCASHIWMWLYCLLALIIPTVLGTFITMIQGILHIREWEHLVPTVLFSMAHAVNVVVFMILGVVLLSDLYEDKYCESFYADTHPQLYILFFVQVVVFVIATITSVSLTIFQLYFFCCNDDEPEQQELLFERRQPAPSYGVAAAQDYPTTEEKMYV